MRCVKLGRPKSETRFVQRQLLQSLTEQNVTYLSKGHEVKEALAHAVAAAAVAVGAAVAAAVRADDGSLGRSAEELLLLQEGAEHPQQLLQCLARRK